MTRAIAILLLLACHAAAVIPAGVPSAPVAVTNFIVAPRQSAAVPSTGLVPPPATNHMMYFAVIAYDPAYTNPWSAISDEIATNVFPCVLTFSNSPDANAQQFLLVGLASHQYTQTNLVTTNVISYPLPTPPMDCVIEVIPSVNYDPIFVQATSDNIHWLSFPPGVVWFTNPPNWMNFRTCFPATCSVSIVKFYVPHATNQ